MATGAEGQRGGWGMAGTPLPPCAGDGLLCLLGGVNCFRSVPSSCCAVTRDALWAVVAGAVVGVAQVPCVAVADRFAAAGARDGAEVLDLSCPSRAQFLVFGAVSAFSR